MGRAFHVGKAGDFPESRARVVTVDGERVAVFRVAGRLFALRDACPHMGASLGDGAIVGGEVVCHRHGWRFDLETGRGNRRSSACARVYGVEIRGDDVMLRPPDPPPAPEPEDEDPAAWDPDRYFKDRKPPDEG